MKFSILHRPGLCHFRILIDNQLPDLAQTRNAILIRKINPCLIMRKHISLFCRDRYEKTICHHSLIQLIINLFYNPVMFRHHFLRFSVSPALRFINRTTSLPHNIITHSSPPLPAQSSQSIGERHPPDFDNPDTSRSSSHWPVHISNSRIR